MPASDPGPKGPTRKTPARSNLTPSGHKNVRVFVTQALWYQLVSHSAGSEMSLQDFVVAWLERATPLTPGSCPSGGATAAVGPLHDVPEPAPVRRPTEDTQAGPPASPFSPDGNVAGAERTPTR